MMQKKKISEIEDRAVELTQKEQVKKKRRHVTYEVTLGGTAFVL